MPSISFTLDNYRITDTRSRHRDTNFVTVSMTVGAAASITRTRAMGNQNNGTFAVGLNVAAEIPASADVPVVFSYIILNNGHGSQEAVESAVERALALLGQKAAQAATTAAGSAAGAALGATIGTAVVPVIGTAIGALAGWVTTTVGGLLFANCDGVVATGIRIFTAQQLLRETSGRPIVETVEHPGTDSPSGCGGNSRYFTTTSIAAR